MPRRGLDHFVLVLVHPRRRLFFSVITPVPRYLHGQHGVVVFVSYTQSRPRLGLVARSRHITHLPPHLGPLCRWVGETAGLLPTSAPSHRADEPPGPQAPGKQARLVHTDRTGCSGRGARMRCPGASVLCLSPSLVALLLPRLAIRSGQSHPGSARFVHSTALAQ